METTWKLQSRAKNTQFWFDLGTFTDLNSMFDAYEQHLRDDMTHGEADDYEYRELRITNLPKIQAL